MKDDRVALPGANHRPQGTDHQAIAETDFLDLEIKIERTEFGSERNTLHRVIVECVPQEVAESRDRKIRRLVRSVENKR